MRRKLPAGRAADAAADDALHGIEARIEPRAPMAASWSKAALGIGPRHVAEVPEGDLGLGPVARGSIVTAGGTHCGIAGPSQDVVLQTLPLASGVWVVDDFPKMSVQVTEVTGVDAPGSIV